MQVKLAPMLCLGQCGYFVACFCLVYLDRFRFLKKKPALPHTNMEQVFFAAATGFQVVPVSGEGLAMLGEWSHISTLTHHGSVKHKGM